MTLSFYATYSPALRVSAGKSGVGGGEWKVRSMQISVLFVVRSRQVCIYVVEVLLIVVYLSEGKGAYIHSRPTLLPEATLPPMICLADLSFSTQLNPRPSLYG